VIEDSPAWWPGPPDWSAISPARLVLTFVAMYLGVWIIRRIVRMTRRPPDAAPAPPDRIQAASLPGPVAIVPGRVRVVDELQIRAVDHDGAPDFTIVRSHHRDA